MMFTSNPISQALKWKERALTGAGGKRFRLIFSRRRYRLIALHPRTQDLLDLDFDLFRLGLFALGDSYF